MLGRRVTEDPDDLWSKCAGQRQACDHVVDGPPDNFPIRAMRSLAVLWLQLPPRAEETPAAFRAAANTDGDNFLPAGSLANSFRTNSRWRSARSLAL